MTKKINCRQCKFFYTTWEPANPNGCKFYGFKSKMIPSIVVNKESNRQCSGFVEKEIFKQKRKDDLNDNSNW